MAYSYNEIFSKNSEIINRLIAEHIMGEPEPKTIHDHIPIETVIYSEQTYWVCILQYEKGDVCEWHPVNFCGSIKWAWQVVIKINKSENITLKRKFKIALEVLSPFNSITEKECCRKICRAALLANLSRIPKILTKF